LQKLKNAFRSNSENTIFALNFRFFCESGNCHNNLRQYPEILDHKRICIAVLKTGNRQNFKINLNQNFKNIAQLNWFVVASNGNTTRQSSGRKTRAAKFEKVQLFS